MLLSACNRRYAVSWKNCEQAVVYRASPGLILRVCQQLLGATLIILSETGKYGSGS